MPGRLNGVLHVQAAGDRPSDCHNGRECPLAQVKGLQSAAAQRAVIRVSRQLVESLNQVEQVLEQLPLSPDTRQQNKTLALDEFVRRVPEWLKIATLIASLPSLRTWAKGHFMTKGFPSSDLEDLSQSFVTKILEAFFKTWPKGNAGAWVTAIRDNVGHDLGRKERCESRLGRRKSADMLAYLPIEAGKESDQETNEEDLWQFVAGLPDPEGQIVLRRLRNQCWSSIAKDLGMTAQQAKAIAQRIVWPGGSSPLPTKRRTK